MRGAPLLILALSLLTALAVSAFGAPSDFTAAARNYEMSQYPEALDGWRQSAGNAVSPSLLHNFGNAEFKLGHLGEAIAAWERAHALDPWNRNTIANLRFARGEAGLETPTLSWYEIYSSWMPPDDWLWLATVTFWSGLACMFLPSLLKLRRTAGTQAGAVIAISIFILTLPALAGIATRNALGVVIAPETSLRLTPTQEAEVLGHLPAGEIARIEIVRGDYLYVRGEADRAGWVQRDEFTRLWE
ncbi:MAG: hypothetical protein ABI680_19430 [Chthoniobacteraceae bacterium]